MTGRSPPHQPQALQGTELDGINASQMQKLHEFGRPAVSKYRAGLHLAPLRHGRALLAVPLEHSLPLCEWFVRLFSVCAALRGRGGASGGAAAVRRGWQWPHVRLPPKVANSTCCGSAPPSTYIHSCTHHARNVVNASLGACRMSAGMKGTEVIEDVDTHDDDGASFLSRAAAGCAHL